jgi:hypothetical protein
MQATEAGIEAAQSQHMDAVRANRANQIRTLQDRRAVLEREWSALSGEIESHKKALIQLLGVDVTITTGPGRCSNLVDRGLKIRGLDDQIRRLQEPFPDTGVVDVENATTIDPLVEALASFEGSIPPMASVLDWMSAVEPVPGETFRDLPRRIHLVWANGDIDCQQSTVFVEALCTPGMIGIYSGKPRGVNIESGTFRVRAAARV